MTRPLLRASCGTLLLAAGFAASSVEAAERRAETEGTARFGFSAGAMYSDNPGRTRFDNEGETSLEAGMDGSLKYERDRVAADIQADLLYRSRSYSSYGDEVIGGLTGVVSYALLHDSLLWVVEENFGQSLISSIDKVTPENTQDLNVLSTGPDAIVPLGSRTAIQLQGRWTDVTYQESDYGNRRLSGLFGLRRQLGESSNVSLNASTERIDYKELPASSDYRIHSTYLAWDAVGAKTTLTLRAGYSELRESADSTNGKIFELDLVRRISSRSTLTLNAGRNFGDSADILKREQGIRGVSIGDRPAITSSDPLRTEFAGMRWEANSGRGSVRMSVDWKREVHQRDANLDRHENGGRLQVDRKLSPRLSVAISASYISDDYKRADISFDEWGAGLGLNWAWSPTFGMGVDWGRLVGNGDTAIGPGTRDYIENRYTFRLRWSPER